MIIIFSATDVVRAINDEPDYTKAGNYWSWLKRKLKQEVFQLVSPSHGFKFEAPDGKRRIADVLNSDGVLVAKHYLNNKATSDIFFVAIIFVTSRKWS